MQVFKTFFFIAKRNLGMMLMFAAIFLGLSITLSNTVPEQSAMNFEDAKLPVTVIDRDQSALSQAIGAYLYEEQRAVPLQDGEAMLRDALYQRKTEYILFLPQGFGEALEAGEAPLLQSATVPGSYAAAYVDSQLQGYLNTLRAYLAAGFSETDAVAHTAEDLRAEVPVTLAQGTVKTSPTFSITFSSCALAWAW